MQEDDAISVFRKLGGDVTQAELGDQPGAERLNSYCCNSGEARGLQLVFLGMDAVGRVERAEVSSFGGPGSFV